MLARCLCVVVDGEGLFRAWEASGRMGGELLQWAGRSVSGRGAVRLRRSRERRQFKGVGHAC